MSAVSLTRCLFRVLNTPRIKQLPFRQLQERNVWIKVDKPEPGVGGKSYRRIVHFPEKYTVKPLEVTNLGGRDPVSGK